MKKYLLDTNIFLEAYLRFYPFSFCKAFWDLLDKANKDGQLISVNEVYQEIIKPKKKDGTEIETDDALSDWAKKRGSNLFLNVDKDISSSYEELSKYITNNYSLPKVSKFMLEADYFLIAYAKAYNCILVTYELFSDKKTKQKNRKIQIPDVCKALGVECINGYEMIERLGAKFVLGE